MILILRLNYLSFKISLWHQLRAIDVILNILFSEWTGALRTFLTGANDIEQTILADRVPTVWNPWFINIGVIPLQTDGTF